MESLTRDDEVVQDSFQAIGADLSSARVELGMQVSEIAQLLRISRNYIKNIEAGDFDQLPGPTYVSGYLRSYSRAVGLDPESFPQRYRALVDGHAVRPQYDFPVDTQRPQRSGAMMASIMVIFTVAGYGGWYAAGKPDLLQLLTGGQEPPMISAPEVASAVIEADNLVTPEPASAPAVIDPIVADSSVSAESTSSLILPAEVNSTGDDTSEVAATVSASASDDQASDEVVKTAVAGGLATAADGSSGGDAAANILSQTETLKATTVDGIADATDAAPASALPVIEVDATDGVVTELASAGDDGATDIQAIDPIANDGEEASSTTGVAFAMQRVPELEITVRATGTSWVEIIRNDGEEVMTQLMRKGETYVVDSRDKLYLSTGNAGGLELLFHDGTVRSIGVSGEILRDLPLDAERLRNQL